MVYLTEVTPMENLAFIVDVLLFIHTRIVILAAPGVTCKLII